MQKDLQDEYTETCTKYKEDPDNEDYFFITVEIKMYLTDKDNAKKHVDAINERLDAIKENVEEMVGKESPCIPKFHQKDNCFMIGCTIPIKRSMAPLPP